MAKKQEVRDMAWWTVGLLAAVLGGAFWAWYKVNTHESGAVSCCGCGQCARTGECVMVKKSGKKGQKPS